MKYYRFHEYNPDEWDNTETILAMGATHYGTNMIGDVVLRKFVIRLSEEDVLAAILKFGDKVDISLMKKDEIEFLKAQGYIKS